MKVGKGRYPKALDDYAYFIVLCQVGRVMYAFCYQFLMSFVVLEYSLSTIRIFFTFIIPGSSDIAQVVQTVQIDLQKFRFT